MSFIIRQLLVFIWHSTLHSFDWLSPYLVRMQFHQQLAIQITLGAVLTLSILVTATYLAIRWMGWRSLVIFLVTPTIWVVLALYSNPPTALEKRTAYYSVRRSSSAVTPTPLRSK